jgi:putative ABC transport system substrate-binding protein
MKRRQFITLLGGAAAWPIAARAQQPERMRRIGALISGGENAPQTQARYGAFRKGLEALGWIEGRNLRIDVRYASTDDQYRTYAAEMVALASEVILSSPTGLRPLQQATRAIPIVFVVLLDPVGEGFVANLARPGGNMTGFAAYDPSIQSKYLQLLKEIAPNITHVTYLFDPAVPAITKFADETAAAAPFFGLTVGRAPVHNAIEVEQSIEAVAREPNGALILANNTPIVANLDLILALSTRYRLPAMSFYRFFADSGGLVSYGFDDVDQFRQAASYVDRILKGEKPGELPVQYPAKYQLFINLKTAGKIGLEISPALLSVADGLIE